MYVYRASGEDILLKWQMLPLIFGYYAWDDKDEKRLIKEAGSGIFVAPRLGITAKHLTKSFKKLDPQFDALARRRTPLDPQYQTVKVKSGYAAMAYQITGRREPPVGEEQMLWKVHVDWPSYDTDIDAVEVEPRTLAATAAEPEHRYFEWHLLPPPVGSIVRVYGFPEQKIEVEGVDHRLDINMDTYSARVVEHLYPMETHGFSEFPAFRLHREFAGGFSGGPVLYQNRLVGLFSGPDLVACLWPLALMTYPDSNDVERSFADHFDSGFIQTWDWDEVKGRVKRVPCHEALAGTKIQTRCDKKHVVLAQINPT